MLDYADFQGWSLTLAIRRLWASATLTQQEDTVGNRDPHFTPVYWRLRVGNQKERLVGLFGVELIFISLIPFPFP